MRLFSRLPTVMLFILSLGVALVSWRFFVTGVEATMEFVAYHAQLRPIAFFAHVGLAPLALALMPFQFQSGLRRRRPTLHRWMGRIYALAILLSGTGGLVMAFGTTAGPVAACGFGFLAVFWLVTTARAVWLAMNRRIAEHRRWMLRSAALTFAAVTLRLYLPLSGLTGIDFIVAYTAISWLCWVPNLLVIEWWLWRRPTLLPA